MALAAPQPADTVLDIATGAGHTALAFAPHVSQVVAYDLTEPMLVETAKNAANRGLGNVVTRQGPAEKLPFADASFDIVTVRLASHHFADNATAVHAMARVAKPGGRVVVVDNYGPEDEELDTQLQNIEKLRDPSHVRSYPLSVWRKISGGCGLEHSARGNGPLQREPARHGLRRLGSPVQNFGRSGRRAAAALHDGFTGATGAAQH